MLRVYHVTDNPRFALDYSHWSGDMLDAIQDRPPVGVLFATLNIMGAFWTDMIGYYRAPQYVVVLEVADWIADEDFRQGLWFGEEVIITDLDAVRVVRIVEAKPCARAHKFGFEWGDCDGFLNPWGSECSSCGLRPVSFDSIMSAGRLAA